MRLKFGSINKLLAESISAQQNEPPLRPNETSMPDRAEIPEQALRQFLEINDPVRIQER